MASVKFKRAALIHNPVSGRRSRRRDEKIERTRSILGQWVPQVEVLTTSSAGDASRLAREAVAANYDLIAVSGGDGTINEAIDGMAGSNSVLLPLPFGTANVLAELTGIPIQPEHAADLLPQMKTFEVPLGRVHHATGAVPDRLFLLMCGVGVDAGIIYSLDNRLKTYLGEGAYWLGSLDQLHRKLEPFSVHIDGKTYEATFVLVSKSRCYGGGLVITPDADLLASKFEIAIFHGRSPLRYVAYLAQLATRQLNRFPDVTFTRSQRVQFTSIGTIPVYLEVDGELAGRIPATVDIAPKRLKLLLPRNFSTR